MLVVAGLGKAYIIIRGEKKKKKKTMPPLFSLDGCGQI
jgi:hypothetical protein